MEETVALAHIDEPRDVRLWATRKGDKIWVINGHWSGTLVPDGLFIDYTKETVPAVIVWKGMALGKGDYNGAIAWINQEIAEGRGEAICYHRLAWYVRPWMVFLGALHRRWRALRKCFHYKLVIQVVDTSNRRKTRTLWGREQRDEIPY